MPVSDDRLLIKDGRLSEDRFRLIGHDRAIPAAGSVLVEFSRLLGDDSEHLFHKDCCLGVVIGSDSVVEDLEPWIARLALIVIEVPSFSDGRAFSLAEILRGRMEFQGELRATGDLLPDLHQFMCQVGFNSFEIPNNDVKSWLDSDLLMSLSYQTNVSACASDTARSILHARHRRLRDAAA